MTEFIYKGFVDETVRIREWHLPGPFVLMDIN